MLTSPKLGGTSSGSDTASHVPRRFHPRFGSYRGGRFGMTYAPVESVTAEPRGGESPGAAASESTAPAGSHDDRAPAIASRVRPSVTRPSRNG